MHKVDLKDGVQIGKSFYTTLWLDELTAGQALDAAEAAERIQLTSQGEAVIINSPTRVTAERIRRQVKRLESADPESANKEMQGPMTLSDLHALSEGDYILLAGSADFVDGLYAKREMGVKQNSQRFPGTGDPADEPDT